MSDRTPETDYERWVARLYRTPFFYPTSSPSLDRMKRLYELIGSPMDKPDIVVIHVAGTNGKGSVCLKIANSLRTLGCFHTVGLYGSPHVSCFRERIQIDGQLVTEEETANHLSYIYELCKERNIAATFFEITTTLAFLTFGNHHERGSLATPKKSAVILEVGLGGRLDATNIIKCPALAIITSIGLDHTAILGDSHDKIALEKAGIMKRGAPVLVGPRTPVKTLHRHATANSIREFFTVEDVLSDKANVDEDGTLDYDADNTRIALAALFLLTKSGTIPDEIPSNILAESTRAKPSCRYESISSQGKPTVILDVAHNPAAMRSLVSKVGKEHGEKVVRFVVGLSRDKNWRGVLQALFPMKGRALKLSKLHLVQAAHYKAFPLTHLVQSIKQSQLISDPEARLEYNLEDPSVTLQIVKAMELASAEELVVVCGSAYLMAEARRALKIKEPRDSDFLVDVGSSTKPSLSAFGNNEKFPST